METAVEIVRWGGLILALLLTGVLLKAAALVLRTLSDIRELAGWIRRAARGTAKHLEPSSRAAELAEPLERFRAAGSRFSSAADRLAVRLRDRIPEASEERGGTP